MRLVDSFSFALRRGARGLSAQRERGSSTIQMVILLPVLFSAMFLGMQAALIYQGRTLAVAAAQEGARDAAAEHGTLAQGISTAYTFLSSSTAGLSGTSVTGSRTATRADITVTTYTTSVIPGWTPKITQSASMPVERVTGG